MHTITETLCLSKAIGAAKENERWLCFVTHEGHKVVALLTKNTHTAAIFSHTSGINSCSRCINAYTLTWTTMMQIQRCSNSYNETDRERTHTNTGMRGASIWLP